MRFFRNFRPKNLNLHAETVHLKIFHGNKIFSFLLEGIKMGKSGQLLKSIQKEQKMRTRVT